MIFSLMIQRHIGGGGYRGVVNQKEVGLLVKLGGLDAILNHFEFYVSYLQARLFQDLAMKRIDAGLPVLDLAAGNPPFVAPLMGLDEKELLFFIGD